MPRQLLVSAAGLLIATAAAHAVTRPVDAPAAKALAGALPATAAVAKPAPSQLAFRLIAMEEAKKAGLPYAMVDAVMKIESGYHPQALGGVGEIGLMQVRPATAAMMGFRGTPADLADPATNIHYGAAYLGKAWALAGGDVCKTLMKYRAGHGETVMTPLSVTYCQRARVHLASIGSPLAGTITPEDLVVAKAAVQAAASETRPGESLTVHGRPKTGAAFWAAFQSPDRAHQLQDRGQVEAHRVAVSGDVGARRHR